MLRYAPEPTTSTAASLPQLLEDLVACTSPQRPTRVRSMVSASDLGARHPGEVGDLMFGLKSAVDPSLPTREEKPNLCVFPL